MVHAAPGVLHHVDGGARRHRRLEPLHPLEHLRRHVGGGVALRLLDVHPDGLLPVVEREGPLLLGPVPDRGELPQPDQGPVPLGHHQLLEVPGAAGAAAKADGALVPVAGDPAHRGGQVLGLEGAGHLRHRHPRRLERLGPELDGELALELPRHQDLGHPGDGAELARDAGVGQPGQLGGAERVRGQRERHDRPVGVVQLLDDRLFHLRREVVPDPGDGVADVLRGLEELLLEDELDHDHGEAVLRLAQDLLHAADGGDGLLDGVEDLALDRLRRCPRVGDRHRDVGRGHVGELVGLEPEQREEAEHHQRQHGDDGDDGATDGEV